MSPLALTCTFLVEIDLVALTCTIHGDTRDISIISIMHMKPKYAIVTIHVLKEKKSQSINEASKHAMSGRWKSSTRARYAYPGDRDTLEC